MSGATVRINEASRELLRELARRTNTSMQDVIEEALVEYRKRLFWEQADRDFRAMREDGEAWQEEIAERESWDVTLLDGLEVKETP